MITIISLKNEISNIKDSVIRKVWKEKKADVKLVKFIKNSKKSKIFLIGTPTHGNLGDQAIAHAEIKFLQDNCKNFDVFEIHFEQFNYYLKKLKQIIKQNDIIMLHGGGNMGDQYIREEELRRIVISNFKEQKIISFPQTIYFSDTNLGRRELEKTKNIYKEHSKLTIIGRETVSYNKMKDVFKNNNLILTPDIVMYLNENKNVEERNDILFCFRDDPERIVSNDFKQRLYNQLSIKNNVIKTDTVVDYYIDVDTREDELNKVWSTFRKSKLVITDRLHGMVFAAITATPCIALSNYNQKVKGTYEWIKHLPYIKFLEDENEINKYIEELLKLDGNQYDNNFAFEYYKRIIKTISSEILKV
ncbi:polysaccharide pyruvyl transferase family protein [Bacillus sp. OTU2372]|uniref:polysaccharide pyruvyl transferase family protein n=1 Tax=Bacillus sp. OTU2372 TaxID=3043858 RepID=UPI00313DFCED